MKLSNISPTAAILLATGMLLVVAPLLLDRYFSIPDFWNGSITGIGLMLEVIALTKINNKKKRMIIN